MDDLMKIIGIVVLVIGVFLFGGWVFMLLWNVVATYFGFKTITFWIAMCIVLLLQYVGSGTNINNKK